MVSLCLLIHTTKLYTVVDIGQST